MIWELVGSRKACYRKVIPWGWGLGMTEVGMSGKGLGLLD